MKICYFLESYKYELEKKEWVCFWDLMSYFLEGCRKVKSMGYGIFDRCFYFWLYVKWSVLIVKKWKKNI